MENENDWLKDFEVDPDYIVEASRMESKKVLMNQLIQENKNLKRSINPRLEASGKDIEKQTEDLLMKRREVMENKDELLQVLETWKENKEKTVLKTYKQVNKSLNDIFSTLLPGTKARLTPVNKDKFLEEGVQLSVAFNDKWKIGLNELSGGQRSLLALSFILAMMKYKPAPIYILDEIDAALDLENTQNIGEMIKKHFKDSQFVIVSLKEQMTYNASRIYRVANVDGKSKVECIV